MENDRLTFYCKLKDDDLEMLKKICDMPDEIKAERSRMDKEWEVEATIEIKTSFFCETKEEAEKEAHKYLEELCTGLYPDCCSNSYEINDIYSYSED